MNPTRLKVACVWFTGDDVLLFLSFLSVITLSLLIVYSLGGLRAKFEDCMYRV